MCRFLLCVFGDFDFITETQNHGNKIVGDNLKIHEHVELRLAVISSKAQRSFFVFTIVRNRKHGEYDLNFSEKAYFEKKCIV